MLSFKNILVILFGICLPIFLLVNVFIYFNLQYTSVGAIPTLDPNGHSYWDFNYYYFGFHSITAWFKTFPRNTVLDFVETKFNETGNIMRALMEMENVATPIINVLLSMYRLVAGICKFIVVIVGYLWNMVSIIAWLLSIFSGVFNSRLPWYTA